MSIFRALCAGLALACGAFSSHALEVLTPAYFYPSYDPAQSQWDEMEAALATGVKVTAIANMANGPGTAPSSDYQAAINHFRAAGGQVLGYVYTCYGVSHCTSAVPATRSVEEALADVRKYAQWYGVDGIFLDEMSSDPAALPFYQQVRDAIRGEFPTWMIFGNPGTAVPEVYTTVADTLVTFEGSTNFDAAASAPWMAQADPRRQASLLYNVADAAAMRELLAESLARHSEYVYITDDRYTPGSATEANPWDQLPTYWTDEVDAISHLTAVPEPSTVLLLALGVVGVFVARRRSGR